MKKMIHIPAILLCLAMLTGVTACGGSGGQSSSAAPSAPESSAPAPSAEDEHEPVTISILHEHTAEAASNIVSSYGFVEMIKKYKEEHPWVTLEEEIIVDSGDKLFALAASDDLPSVFGNRYGWLPNFAGNGLAADITDYVDPSMYVDDLYCMTYEGRIYGLPNKYSIFNLVLYNEAMWKEAGYETFPTKIEDLIKANEYFEIKGIDTMALGNSGKWFATSLLTAGLTYENCGDEWVESMIARDGTNEWTHEGFVKSLADLQALTPIFNEDCNMQDDVWAMGWYMQGKAASHVVGNWGLDTARNMSGESPEVWANTRVALMPTISGEPNIMSSAVGGNSQSVNSKLKGAEFTAALELVEQICSPDYAELLASRGATAPVRIEVNFDAFEQPYKDFAAILNSHGTGMNITDYVDSSVANALHAAAQNVMTSASTPEAAAADVQAAQSMLLM